jgi:DeoR/GlpR family transcriptional regulator of sugar metabolism
VNQDAKRSIARWAAGLVKNGDTILMDASTTAFNMVPFLAERRGLVVLTNGIEAGRCLAENTSNTVLLVAGVIRSDGSAVVGPLYEPVLRNRHITAAFVSCKGFSLAAGLTEADPNEAAIKSRTVPLTQSVVALIDSNKFGQVYQTPFARADQVTHIFSDDGLEPYWVQQVQEASIVLTRCPVSL